VQFERRHRPNAWEDWRFRITDVVLDEGQFGTRPRLLREDGQSALFLHPGMPVRLHRDEAEGYYLNLASGAPVWFVMWRIDEADPPTAWPEFVTLSYNEAGRLLDAQERVDNVPVPAEVRDWLLIFALRIAALLHRARDDGGPLPVWASLLPRGFQLRIDAGWLTESPLTASTLAEEVRQWSGIGIELQIKSQRKRVAR